MPGLKHTGQKRRLSRNGSNMSQSVRTSIFFLNKMGVFVGEDWKIEGSRKIMDMCACGVCEKYSDFPAYRIPSGTRR